MSDHLDFNSLLDELADNFSKQLVSRIRVKTYAELKNLLRSMETSPVLEADLTPINPLLQEPAPPISEVTEIKSCSTNNVVDNVVEAASDFKYLDDAASLEDAQLDNLPVQYKEAILALPSNDLKAVKAILAVLKPTAWLDTLEEKTRLNLDHILDGRLPKDSITRGAKYLSGLVAKVHRNAIKIQRQKVAAANSLKKIEAAKGKREAEAKKKQEKNDAEEERKKKLESVSNVTTKHHYAPTIEKKNRKKVGIIGLLQTQQAIVTSEFGETFILAMASVDDGMTKIQQVMLCPERKQYAMVDFIAHAHAAQVDKDKLNIIRGGMTRLREALSEYAKESYPS